MTIHSDICAADLDMSSAHVLAGLARRDCGNLSEREVRLQPRRASRSSGSLSMAEAFR